MPNEGFEKWRPIYSPIRRSELGMDSGEQPVQEPGRHLVDSCQESKAMSSLNLDHLKTVIKKMDDLMKNFIFSTDPHESSDESEVARLIKDTERKGN